MRNSRPPWDHSVTDNDTTVFFLSSSDWEIEDGEELPERLIPTKVVTYPTSVRKFIIEGKREEANFHSRNTTTLSSTLR